MQHDTDDTEPCDCEDKNRALCCQAGLFGRLGVLNAFQFNENFSLGCGPVVSQEASRWRWEEGV
jgi:hypothetical protein